MTAESPPAQPEPALLETRNLTKRFEGVVALSNLDLSVRQGSIAALIGPNGAGKTTLFNVASGFYPPDEGTITLGGKRINGLRPHSITSLGIARTFQNIRLFHNMTALKNVLVGQQMHGDFVTRATPEADETEPARRFPISLGSPHGPTAAFPGRMLGRCFVNSGRPGVVARRPSAWPSTAANLASWACDVTTKSPSSYGDQRGWNWPRAGTRPKPPAGRPTAGMNPRMRSSTSVQPDELGTTVLLSSTACASSASASHVLIQRFGGSSRPASKRHRSISRHIHGTGNGAARLIRRRRLRRHMAIQHALKRGREVVALIGNTWQEHTLRTITGLVRRRAGTIRFQGADIGRMAPHEIVAAGISLVPEGRGIFHRLTVMENLSMGAFRRARGSDLNADYENVFTIFPRLKERARQPGGTLSGGEQQMLAIGRALMARPRLLLLDEPSMGLSPILTDIIFETIQDINKRLKTTILLVEQNAYMALAVTSRGYVLESGQIALHASSEDLMADPQVRGAYLGEI